MSATRWQGRIRGVGARELGMPARFEESERFQLRLDVFGRYGDINEDFVLVDARRRGKADGVQEPIEGSIEAAIEAIEQRVFVWREASVAEGRVKAGGAQGSVDALALSEVGLDKFIAAALWSLDNRGVPVVGLLPNASRAVAILQGGAALIAPDFLIAEVCNVASRSARLGRISQVQLGEIAANLPRFFDALVSATVLAPRAVAIAGQLEHPVYDCLYLILAEAEQADLVTADTGLVGKVQATPWSSGRSAYPNMTSAMVENAWSFPIPSPQRAADGMGAVRAPRCASAILAGGGADPRRARVLEFAQRDRAARRALRPLGRVPPARCRVERLIRDA